MKKTVVEVKQENNNTTIAEKDMDLLRERYYSITRDAKDFYESEEKIEALRDDPDILEFRGFLVDNFIDFLTIGAVYYLDHTLKPKAINLIKRQNKYLGSSFYDAFICFQECDNEGMIRNLRSVLKPEKGTSLSEYDFIYSVVTPFKNAYTGFYEDIYKILSEYDVDQIVLDECMVLDEYFNLVQQEKNKDIIELLLPLKGNYPDSIWVNHMLALAYYIDSMWGNAVACFERALDAPNTILWLSEIYFCLGWASGKMKDHKKAIEYYESCLEIDPNREFALNNLGYEYYLTKQYKKALKVFERCMEEKIDLDYAPNNYVQTLVAMKRFADAKDFIYSRKYKVANYWKRKLENKKSINLDIPMGKLPASGANDGVKISSAKAVEFSSEEILEDEIVSRLEKGMKTFGRKLKLYRRFGENGRQYTIPGGRIDVLAEDDEGNIYIIELKKNSGYDDAYDDHLVKYFEWFDKHPITDKKTYGIICLNNPTKELVEKVRKDDRVELFNYKVMFEKIE